MRWKRLTRCWIKLTSADVLFQQPGVLLQPFLGGFVFRTNAFHLPPEARGMVHLAQMHEFVQNKVIPDQWRRLNQLPIQRYRAAPGAGTPSGSLIADDDPPHVQLMRRRKIKNPRREFGDCEFPQVLHHPGTQVAVYIGNSDPFTAKLNRAGFPVRSRFQPHPIHREIISRSRSTTASV